MSDVTITREVAEEGLRYAVRRRGAEHVDTSLSYWNYTADDDADAEAGCIVGHVFEHAGVTPTMFAETYGPDANHQDIWELAGTTRPYTRSAVFIETDAAILLSRAQELQDKVPTPWGEIVSTVLITKTKTKTETEN